MTDNQNIIILIVDDNPLNLKLLQGTLIREGYQVIMSMNGPEARKLAFERPPDLILLDIMMPEENGFEVIKRLKEDSRTVSIPVIFLTAVDELDHKIRGFDLGAVDYITKPFHIREVLSRVRLHLKLSLATNSLVAYQAEKLRQIQDGQASMLVVPEELPEARFSVYYKSLLDAGGDFYDVVQISEDIFGYFVGDMSGHDITTSYMTAAVKALLNQNCIPVYEPVESLRMVNNVLVEVLPDGKYMTACYVRLNRKSKQMTIVNGGHPPVVYLPVKGEPRFIELEGDILGIFSDVYFGHQDIKVKEGDRFFMFTDGLIEKPEEKQVWTGGLQDLLNACFQLKDTPFRESAEGLANLMIGKGNKSGDDIVVLGIEV